MYFRVAALTFYLFASGLACGQTGPCEGYIDSPDAPHKGPRRFNVIQLASSLVDSHVLIVDPEGHRFGVDSRGKRIRSEIPQAFYEDDNTAEMVSNLSAQRQPQVMTVQFAQSGRYLIVTTARKDSSQWLKVLANTCGKPWKQEITIPAAPAGTTTRLTLVYDSRAQQDPQVLMGDRSDSKPLQPSKKRPIDRP